MQCHYEVLGVAQDADAATIKKAHRKLAIKLHPDKNLNDAEAAEKFRLVQEAYECLSDVAERKWYDEHRDALLKGWSPNGRKDDNDVDMLFDVIPFMHAHCYTGYKDGDDQSFYAIYGHVFASLAKEEADAADNLDDALPFEFGNSATDETEVLQFYGIWEGFVSQQTFSWADQYDVKDAENRRVRRAMEDENKKARKAAKKARNEDILALVRFVKRRDPRMKAIKERQEQEKAKREQEAAESKRQKKQEKQQAREQWRQQAEEDLAQTEEMDRLAGRVRLADLEDDYDYGGGKKKGKKGKKKNKKNQQQQQEEDDDDNQQEKAQTEGDAEDDQADEEGTSNGSIQNVDIHENGSPPEDYNSPDEDDEVPSSSEEEEEPDVWRCECCRKDFKSQGQMENHMKSKKHKEAYKKYQKKLEKELMRE